MIEWEGKDILLAISIGLGCLIIGSLVTVAYQDFKNPEFVCHKCPDIPECPSFTCPDCSCPVYEDNSLESSVQNIEEAKVLVGRVYEKLD